MKSSSNPTCKRYVQPHTRFVFTLCLMTGAAFLVHSQAAVAEEWEPFPRSFSLNDFGGVGLIQTPTARFASDGQFFVGGSRVYPYERYFVTVQATSWLEGTLRYSSVDNRLYSNVPEFSGLQSYKDRGLDIKVKLVEESGIRPSVAVGARDFLGTGLFSSEYVVLNKEIGPIDASLGIGWGNMGSRGHIKNPFRLISGRFRDRGDGPDLGGTLSNAYFKGDRVAFFGGISFETPIRGLTAKVEYDPNDYQSEALANRFDVDSPINVGLDYKLRSWLRVGASFERGNRVGASLTLTTNFNGRRQAPKLDAPAPKWPMPESAPETASTPTGALSAASGGGAAMAGSPLAQIEAPRSDTARLAAALSIQGSGLLAADFDSPIATLFVAQGRYRNVATGLGRIGRAAFSMLPDEYAAVKVVLVEGGVETMSATLYRSALTKALEPGRGSTDELFVRTEFDQAPLTLEQAEYRPDLKPGFTYGIRPGLRTTLGRPEQFILYQLWLRLHGALQINRQLAVTGSVGINISNNFDKLRIPSDSQLPRVRSDIAEYLREGQTAITHLQADYTFNIAPSLYGHVYGGLLEEMFGGVGGEVLYRQYDANWAIGADINYAKQRDYDQLFSFRDYDVVTGHVTGFYHFEGANIDAVVKAGRYLAKDWGSTFQLSRTFKSGITVGGFATFTNVSAKEFGEGRFDKGLFLTIPLDILYVRSVRGGVGIVWKPLIRDGGQMLVIRRPLLGTTQSTTKYNFRNDWRDILN